MQPARRFSMLFLAMTAIPALARAAEPGFRLDLHEGWALESSARVTAAGETVSVPGFATSGWHRATVPTTVVSALVADGTYPDPYFGMNLRKLPGMSYKPSANFSNEDMPKDSPFAVPWWYRTEFTLPKEAAGRTVWLRLDGVNFRFDAFLNGPRIASAARPQTSSLISIARTERPCVAAVSMIPRPIVPAPITASRSIDMRTLPQDFDSSRGSP